MACASVSEGKASIAVLLSAKKRGGGSQVADQFLAVGYEVIHHEHHRGKKQSRDARQHDHHGDLAFDGEILKGHYFLSEEMTSSAARRSFGAKGEPGFARCVQIDVNRILFCWSKTL